MGWAQNQEVIWAQKDGFWGIGGKITNFKIRETFCGSSNQNLMLRIGYFLYTCARNHHIIQNLIQ